MASMQQLTFGAGFWVVLYAAAQVLYFGAFLVVGYFLTRTINWVDDTRRRGAHREAEESLPFIVLAYPVLREGYATMHSTLVMLSRMDYPQSRCRIIATPNSDDALSISALRGLRMRFPFLEIVEVPPTSDPRWDAVWRAWSKNPRAYWFHQGSTRGDRNLLPKKTRQLIYLFYTLVGEMGTDWVLDYIDADSMPSADHFRSAAEGLKYYDVLQATNVAGNLLDSTAASFHAYDHMCWDGLLYPHMSANGAHPYYMLGKGLFYRARDLLEIGGFNPWIAIEDPEVGMRLWTNSKRLGIIAAPLIEEVPRTLIRGIRQRSRWMCGFFQSLGSPLRRMGMPFGRRMQARLNIIPVLSLPVNVIGLPTGVYALYKWYSHANPFPRWLVALSLLNVALYLVVTGICWRNAWRRTKFVLPERRLRIRYMLRVNPASLFLYHVLWTVPIGIGFFMFISDLGRVWQRTEKFDADHRFAEPGAGGEGMMSADGGEAPSAAAASRQRATVSARHTS